MVCNRLSVDGRTGHGTARHGTARHGTARQGTARQGTARQCGVMETLQDVGTSLPLQGSQNAAPPPPPQPASGVFVFGAAPRMAAPKQPTQDEIEAESARAGGVALARAGGAPSRVRRASAVRASSYSGGSKSTAVAAAAAVAKSRTVPSWQAGAGAASSWQSPAVPSAAGGAVARFSGPGVVAGRCVLFCS